MIKYSKMDLFKLSATHLVCTFQSLISQTRAKQAATMSEVEWRGRTVPVKIDKVRIFLLGLADNEAAIAQVTKKSLPGLLCQCSNISCFSNLYAAVGSG